jgi:hypothetical protein
MGARPSAPVGRSDQGEGGKRPMSSRSRREQLLRVFFRHRQYGRRPLAPLPTGALPGSNEKIVVMTWRESMGYELHHPLDRRSHGPDLPGVCGNAGPDDQGKSDDQDGLSPRLQVPLLEQLLSRASVD